MADFRVHTRGAGSGELIVSVKGPSKTPPTWHLSALGLLTQPSSTPPLFPSISNHQFQSPTFLFFRLLFLFHLTLRLLILFFFSLSSLFFSSYFFSFTTS